MRRLLLCFLLLSATIPARAQTLAREFAQADAAWKRDDYAGAQTHFDRALQAAGDDQSAQAQALYGRGVMRVELFLWDAGYEDLTRSLEIEPDNASAWAARGMAAKGLGNYSGLLADARHAARLDSEYEGFADDAQSTVNWRRALLETRYWRWFWSASASCLWCAE